MQEYRTRLSDINVRTCKKVAEAKARKKRKAIKVMEKLRKKTEAITDNDAMTEKEKVANIKKYVFGLVCFSALLVATISRTLLGIPLGST